MRNRFVVIFFLLMLVIPINAKAKVEINKQEKTIVVGVSEVEPTSFKKNGKWNGFDIDIWNSIAKRLGYKTTYKEIDLVDKFNALKDGTIDMALGAISVTGARERIVDFLHHYFDSGLRILVLADGDDSLWSRIKMIKGKVLSQLIGLFIILIFISGFILYLVERGNNKGIRDKPSEGIEDGSWCAFAAKSTIGFGDKVPMKRIGKMVVVFIWILGTIYNGIMFSQMTSDMIYDKMACQISSPRDLFGKTVATKRNTTTVDVLEELGADVVLCKNTKEAYQLLLDKKVDAVVYDSPAIMYFARRNKKKVLVAGNVFEKQYYAFAINENNDEFRELVNREILKIYQDGTHKKYYRKWFGVVAE